MGLPHSMQSFKTEEPEYALFEAMMALKDLYFHDALKLERHKDLPAKLKLESIKKAERLFKKYEVCY